MNKNGFFSARKITWLGILMALVIALQALGSTITIGAVQLNFSLIPIVLGAILLGPCAGLLLGLANGVVVLIQVIMALSPFYTLIWTGAPVVSALTCVVKTTVAGFVSGITYKILEKKNKYVAVFVASAIVPIVNTLLFIVGCLCMWETIAIWAGGTNILGYILVSLVTFNFFLELAVNLIVAPSLNRLIRVVDRNFQ